MISLEEICRRLEQVFEPAKKHMSERAMQKLVTSNIKQLNDFFEDTGWSLDGENTVFIAEQTIANPNAAGGYIKTYCLLGRMFSETEIRLLCDSILFSPGIDQKSSRQIITKLRGCISKYFGDWFEYVKYVDVIRRTNNERLFEYLIMIGSAMKKKRKISFFYKKNGTKSEKEYIVSPYYLVISSGKYYLLCNKDGKESVAPYRLDRMEEVVVKKGAPIRKIETLQEVNGPFDLKQFMVEHPRMTFEKPVNVTLLVSERMIEAVETEFYVLSKHKVEPTQYRVRISSTKTSICNWIINVTDQIKIESASDHSIIDLLCERARLIIEVYYPMILECQTKFLT